VVAILLTVFVVDDRYGISGAHAPEVFTEVLTRAAADRFEHSV
jgi:predicted DsbA family dithiol-disulfide isomerase